MLINTLKHRVQTQDSSIYPCYLPRGKELKAYLMQMDGFSWKKAWDANDCGCGTCGTCVAFGHDRIELMTRVAFDLLFLFHIRLSPF